MVSVLCNLHYEISLNDPNLDVIINMADYTWFCGSHLPVCFLALLVLVVLSLPFDKADP